MLPSEIILMISKYAHVSFRLGCQQFNTFWLETHKITPEQIKRIRDNRVECRKIPGGIFIIKNTLGRWMLQKREKSWFIVDCLKQIAYNTMCEKLRNIPLFLYNKGGIYNFIDENN